MTGVQTCALPILANGKTKAVVLESGAFKKAGKVYVTGAATMKAAALLLP